MTSLDNAGYRRQGGVIVVDREVHCDTKCREPLGMGGGREIGRWREGERDATSDFNDSYQKE